MKLRNRIPELLEKYMKTHKGTGKDGQATQTDVARAIGVDPATLSRYKADYVKRYDSDVLEKVCKFFGVPISDVLYFEEGEKG